MRRQATLGALLLVTLGIVLGATVFRSDIAQATGLAQSVTVNNTASNPVPVREQGTANVNVTNSSLTVSEAPVIGGGGAQVDFADTDATVVNPPVTASALTVVFRGGVGGVLIFSYQGNEVLRVPNEEASATVSAFVHVPLTLPVKFDELRCTIPGPDDQESCVAFYAGATQ